MNQHNDQCDRLAREGEHEFYMAIKDDPVWADINPMSGDTYAHCDFKLDTTGGTHYVIEVKKRTFPSTSPLAQRPFLEAQKFFDLEGNIHMGHEVRYVNVFSDGAIYVFNLNEYLNTRPQPEWREMKYKTGKEWLSYPVKKAVFLLDLNKAIRIK